MRYLTGIQPSGALHLGNYFGAIAPVLEAQRAGHEVFLFIADYHALTTTRDPSALRMNVRELAKDLMAVGLVPEQTCLFVQSDIREIPEIALLFTMFARMGLLQRSHAYKDKVAKGVPCDLGLFTYPVLMAADILAYAPDVVPVGKDQEQHLEIATDIARRIHNHFGEVFPVIPRGEVSRVPLLPGTDGGKMSKSVIPANTISPFEEYGKLRKLVNSIATAPVAMEAPKPKETPLLGIYEAVATNAEYLEMVSDFERGGVGYGALKGRVLDALERTIGPFREARAAVSDEETKRVLREGAVRAGAVARETLEKLRRAVGLAG